jgi:hypothetical protein
VAKFRAVTRWGDLDKVLEGIKAAQDAGLETPRGLDWDSGHRRGRSMPGSNRPAPSRRNLPLDALEVESVETVLPAESSGCQIGNVAFVRLGLRSGGHRKKGDHYRAA